MNISKKRSMDITILIEDLIRHSSHSSHSIDTFLSEIQNAPPNSFFCVDEILFDDSFTLPPHYKIQDCYVFPSHPIEPQLILRFLLQFDFYHIPHEQIVSTIDALEIFHVAQKIKEL